ncbi:MAG: hypothetical protein PHI35_07910, partial [Victivallaceae bacterium]|nr:hypothetical protein [Victivallaceae bacterium]
MLRLNHLFGDHAVLQRDRRIPVWGWCEPFRLVTGKLGGNRAVICSGDDGKFMLNFPPMQPGGPYELEITVEGSDEKLVSHDIMIGEVWLAGGQSNMEFTLTQCESRFPGLLDRLAANPHIRMITVPRVARLNRMSDFTADWQTASIDNFGYWSAVAAVFADRLAKELGVTVGIISSNWGGTVAAAWTGRETIARNNAYAALIQRDEAEFSSPEYWADIPADMREIKANKNGEPPLPPQPDR